MKSTARRQWCFIAVLAAFSFMGSGDTSHYELEGPALITSEQSFCPSLLDKLSTLEVDLEKGNAILPSKFTCFLSVCHRSLIRTQNQRIQRAFKQYSFNQLLIELTVFSPKKIPTGDFEEA